MTSLEELLNIIFNQAQTIARLQQELAELKKAKAAE